LQMSYPDVYFLLAGKGIDYLNQDICNRLKESPNLENIYLLGERHDINKILASIDISVSSSISEGMPSVIGESMSCCVPCVVTDVGDSKYLVGNTGIAVPKQNPEALFEAIKTLIDAGPEYRTKLGETARKRIIENFSLDKFVNRYESLYQEYVN
jgi:glycosyltransferase involved in cell wall biosynthesis